MRRHPLCVPTIVSHRWKAVASGRMHLKSQDGMDIDRCWGTGRPLVGEVKWNQCELVTHLDGILEGGLDPGPGTEIEGNKFLTWTEFRLKNWPLEMAPAYKVGGAPLQKLLRAQTTKRVPLVNSFSVPGSSLREFNFPFLVNRRKCLISIFQFRAGSRSCHWPAAQNTRVVTQKYCIVKDNRSNQNLDSGIKLNAAQNSDVDIKQVIVCVADSIAPIYSKGGNNYLLPCSSPVGNYHLGFRKPSEKVSTAPLALADSFAASNLLLADCPCFGLLTADCGLLFAVVPQFAACVPDLCGLRFALLVVRSASCRCASSVHLLAALVNRTSWLLVLLPDQEMETLYIFSVHRNRCNTSPSRNSCKKYPDSPPNLASVLSGALWRSGRSRGISPEARRRSGRDQVSVGWICRCHRRVEGRSPPPLSTRNVINENDLTNRNYGDLEAFPSLQDQFDSHEKLPSECKTGDGQLIPVQKLADSSLCSEVNGATENNKDVYSSRPTSATMAIGMYSASDPVHVPSADLRSAGPIGAARRQVGVVGSQRQTYIHPSTRTSVANDQFSIHIPVNDLSPSTESSGHRVSTPKSGSFCTISASEPTMYSISISRGGFSGTRPSSRPNQQIMAHQKGYIFLSM
ncbi:hypothetical protein KSP40_PGU003210 [Platanthera guangdongensis]|uniref:Uncharacterized protein n=1 Tax=Platanthera guangdongensis TaxID=2320717 RepID=A0ABR2LJX1_9ASPA